MGNSRRTGKNRRIAMKKTNIVKYVERLGLEAGTTYDNTPFFFLFVELDTKDKNILTSMLKRLLNIYIPLLWYPSNKGYHIISPALIPLQKWLRLCKASQEIYPNKWYMHDVIRISKKAKDVKVIYSENADTKGNYKISKDLIKILELRFECKLPFPNMVKTPLFLTKYEDIELL